MPGIILCGHCLTSHDLPQLLLTGEKDNMFKGFIHDLYQLKTLLFTFGMTACTDYEVHTVLNVVAFSIE